MAEIWFDLKVGFTCNNDCVHCVVGGKRNIPDLTTQEIKEIIDSVPKEQGVVFTGGEPTMRKDFIELLRYTKEKGHDIYLQTNGAMFCDIEFTKECSKYLYEVLIAIHSHIKEVHDAIVNVSGMYEQTIQGFKNLVACGVNCNTQTVISKYNIKNLYGTYEFIQDISPNIHMNLTYPHPMGSALLNADITVPRFSDIAVYIQPILKRFHKNLSTEAIPMCYLYPYQDLVDNLDEDIKNKTRPGLDPANKSEDDIFDKDGRIEDYKLSDLREKRKSKECECCIFNKRCLGVWKEYINIHKGNIDLFRIE